MSIIKKIFYIFTPIILGVIVSIFIDSSSTYNVINKPILSPPGIVFPIVWSIIYLLIGISYYLFKKNYIYDDRQVSIVYYISLFINITWSIVFFTFKAYFISIIWIIILDILVYYLISLYKEKYNLSYKLNIPYLIWILFATYLTIGVYLLN